MSEVIERATAAFLDAIPGSVYVDDDWDGGDVCIDGTFNVSFAVRAAIGALREPLERAAFSGASCPEDVGFNISQFFDAALAE